MGGLCKKIGSPSHAQRPEIAFVGAAIHHWRNDVNVRTNSCRMVTVRSASSVEGAELQSVTSVSFS